MDNAGDILINRNLLKLVREFGRVHASTGTATADFLNQLGLQSEEDVSASQWALAAKALARSLAGHWGNPGSNYLMLTPGDIGGDVRWQHYLRWLVFAVLKMAGVRIIHLGMSFNTMTPRRAALEKAVANLCHFQGFRDELSAQKALAIGIIRPDYFPDLALLSEHVRRLQPTRDGPPTIALSFRSDNLTDMQARELRASLSGMLRNMRGKISQPVVMCSQVIGDLHFLQRVAEDNARDHSFMFVETTSLAELDQLYDNVDFIFSNRLHALLIGAARGAIPLAMIQPEKNSKVVGLFKSIGLTDLVIYSPSTPTLEDICSKEWQKVTHDRISRTFSIAKMDALRKFRKIIA